MTTAATSLGNKALDRLCGELRLGLGAFGYQWLCACAIYPRLRFALSGYLGATLAETLGRAPVAEHEMLALYRLPWFREGHMPVELRSRLIADLEPEVRAAALAGIERALYATAIDREGERGREALLAPEPPRRWRPMLHAWLGAAPVDAVERDTLFARALTGQTTDTPALARDRARARLFGWRLARLLTWRTFGVLAAITLLAMGWATAGSWLKPWFENERTIEKPAPTTTPLPPITPGPPPKSVAGATAAPPAASPSSPSSPPPAATGRAPAGAIPCPRGQVSRANSCLACPSDYVAAPPVSLYAPALCVRKPTTRVRVRLPTCYLEVEHEKGSCNCPAGSEEVGGDPALGTCSQPKSDGVSAPPPTSQETCAGLPLAALKECSCPPGTEVGTESSSDDKILTCEPSGSVEQASSIMRSAQNALKRLGFYSGYVDGVPGPATRSALRDFQKRYRLEQTGELDAYTIRRLGIIPTTN